MVFIGKVNYFEIFNKWGSFVLFIWFFCMESNVTGRVLREYFAEKIPLEQALPRGKYFMTLLLRASLRTAHHRGIFSCMREVFFWSDQKLS